MANGNFSRVIWRISLPLIFVEAAETIDHLIDTLFLARVGVTELGAIGVADAVMLLFLIAPLCMVDGVQILTARRIGQRRPEAAGAAFNQGFLLVLLLSLLATVALKLFSPVVAYWLVGSESVGDALDSYLQLDAYSIPLAGVTFTCSALLTSLGKTRALVPATVILVITDIVLNYLFIFGKFGFPELGMKGAAVGSIGAELAVAVFLSLHVKRNFTGRKYGFFNFRGFEHKITRLLVLLSAPLAAQCLLEDVRWFVFFLIIERLGTKALAIANIAFTCYLVFWIPTVGFAETACSMVGRFVGRNRTQRIGAVLRSATRGAILATVPFLVLALFTPQWLAAVFSPDADLLGPSSASLRIIAFAMLIAIPAHMWYQAVVGTGDTAAALGIECLLTLVMLGLTWLSAVYLGWPVALIWLSVAVTSLVCLVVSYGWMKSGIWKRHEL